MAAPAAEVHYRVAEVRDHPEVVALMVELVRELGPAHLAARLVPRLPGDMAQALAAPGVRIFLAEQDDGPVGLGRADVLERDPTFRLRDDVRCGYVDQMYVAPAARGLGIGKMLLGLCEAWFRRLEIGHCLLHAAPRAVSFYEHSGYQSNRQLFKVL